MSSPQTIEKQKRNQTISHHNTVFSQLLKLASRHEFKALAKQHHSGRFFRTASRWSHVVMMKTAQLSSRNNLRDIGDNLSAQAHRLYHFKTPLYSLDASTIDLYLSIFPWPDFRSTKGTIKLHVGLNHAGYLPEFISLTEGKDHDVTIGRTLKLPKQTLLPLTRVTMTKLGIFD